MYLFFFISLIHTFVTITYLSFPISAKLWKLYNPILNFNANKLGMAKQIYNASISLVMHTLYTVKVKCKSPCRGVRWDE